MLRVRWYSRVVAVSVALAAGVLALSCGGGAERESVTAPPTLAAPEVGGSVTASATAKQDLCHYDATLGTYTTLSLTSQAVAAHLKSHGKDYAGVCRTASCPCFTAEQLALACDGRLAECPAPQYTLSVTCASTTTGARDPLGYWIVVPQELWCDGYMPSVGSNPHSNISADEAEACKQLIVNSPGYPASCPR